MSRFDAVIEWLENMDCPDNSGKDNIRIFQELHPKEEWQRFRIGHFLSSVDEALLISNKSLGNAARITTMGDDAGLCCYCRFVIFPKGLGEEEGKIDVRGWHQSLAVAIMIALFKALQAKEIAA